MTDEFEEKKMAKTRPVPENYWHQLYVQLISQIPESMKKSEDDIKQKVMRLFE